MRTIKTVLPVMLGFLFVFGGITGLAHAGSQATMLESATAMIIYVDADATGGNDGSSWDDAYSYLQDALDRAKANGSTDYEIWVAEGVYYPDEDSNGDHTAGSESEAFTFANDNIQLYGGFSGVESVLAERDWTANRTVLSGDIDNNDITDTNGVVISTTHIIGSNSTHVIYIEGSGNITITAATVLDGFTITAGQADGNDHEEAGGGFFCYAITNQCSPTLTNLTFSGNLAAEHGGAMINMGELSGVSSPTLTNVTFSGNSSNGDGGAMSNIGMASGISSPTLTDVTFNRNSAFGGGAMSNISNNGSSSPTLTNVTFSNNSAYGDGVRANIGNDGPIRSILTNVIFSGNADYGDGGALFNVGLNDGISSPSLTNVTFSGNSAAGFGGAIANMGEYSGISSPTLTDVTFSSNSANGGGAMSNLGNDGSSSPTLTNVIFSGNSALFAAGAIFNYGNGSAINPILTNVTFSGNSAATAGGAMYNYNDDGTNTPILTNVIMAGNTADEGDQIYNEGVNSMPQISYSDIEGCGGSDAWNSDCGADNGENIDAAPLFFRDPDAGDGDWTTPDDNDYGDLHLQGGSPAIDSGTNSGCPAADLEGNPRPLNGACDMGAYENHYALTITQSADNLTPNPGQTVTITVVVENSGSLIRGGVITDSLPGGLNFVGPVTLDPTDAGQVGDSLPILASDLTFANAEQITVTFPVTVSYDLTGDTELVNTVAVTDGYMNSYTDTLTILVESYLLYIPILTKN